jgi:hypothetical protein
MESFSPEPDEGPLFCLLSDDRLITDVSLTTDRLLMPLESNERLRTLTKAQSATSASVTEIITEITKHTCHSEKALLLVFTTASFAFLFH